MKYILKNVVVIWILLFIVVAGCMQSCTSVEKQIAKAKVIAYNNPKSFAKFCADCFPVKETFKKGDEVVKIDTVTSIDTVYLKQVINGDTVFVKVPCPSAKTITKTVRVVDTIYRENTAKSVALEEELKEVTILLSKETSLREQAEKRSGQRMSWMIGLTLALVVMVYLRFRE